MPRIDWEKNRRNRKPPAELKFTAPKLHLFKIKTSYICARSHKEAWWKYFNEDPAKWLVEATEEMLKQAIKNELSRE